MSDESEVIQQQMQETRTALTDKLETLEAQVVNTVSEANTAVVATVESVKDAVQETMNVVKGSVHETVDSVKHAMDLSRQVDRHPWLLMGGAAALGYLGGCLLRRAVTRPSRGESPVYPLAPPIRIRPSEEKNGRGTHPLQDNAEEAARPSPVAGWLSKLEKELAPEIDKVKSLAIGVGLGLVRDLITESAPEQLQPRLTEVMDDITVKLGGETIRGPVLSTSSETGKGASTDHRNGRRREAAAGRM